VQRTFCPRQASLPAGPRERVSLDQDGFFADVDLVWRRLSLGQFDIIPDLALEADIRNQSAARFRVQPGQVAGVRVAVGVTVHDIEEVDEIITILNITPYMIY
jgi:hypothetical protein